MEGRFRQALAFLEPAAIQAATRLAVQQCSHNCFWAEPPKLVCSVSSSEPFFFPFIFSGGAEGHRFMHLRFRCLSPPNIIW